MAKRIPTQAYPSLLNALAYFPDGASLPQLEAALTSPPHRRTLQRWLNELIALGAIRRSGQGRASQYHATPPAAPPPRLAEPPSASYAATSIPLGNEARWIEQHIRQPLPLRQPVGYQQAFLEDYLPNQTFYLPATIREELRGHGQAIPHSEPAGTYARQLAHRLLIDLSWNSSRLEGNTYSLLETEHLISAGEVASGHNALEAQMILNHKAAIEFLIDSATDIGFNRYTLLNLHALLSDNLLDDPGACGRLRTIPVGIGQTAFMPLEGPQRIDECFRLILDKAHAIQDPFEQAFFAMVHLPYLQPFEDVNKRVSRLAANIPLIQHNLCPLSFVDVPQTDYISAMLGVYELNRTELLRDVFVWAYKRSCTRYSSVRQSLGEPDPFRLHYRLRIQETVTTVVVQAMNKSQAAHYIQHIARQHLPAPDQQRFIEVVDTQLLTLHEGSMARYRIRPSQFQHWQAAWQPQPTS